MPRSRKLIVHGNCQAGAVSDVLRLIPEIADDWEIVLHDLWRTGKALERQLADFADAGMLLFQDVRNWRHHPLRDTLSAGLRVVRFPFIYVAALWPLDSFIAGDDAAMARAMAALGGADANPIPFGFQDAVLGRLRAEIADPDERLRRHRALESENPPDLILYAEFEAARLLDRHRKTGMSIGRFVIDRCRNQRLFHAIVHPATGLIEQLAGEILPRMGMEVTRALAEAACLAYEAKKALYDAKKGRRGGKPKPPDDTPSPERQSNLTDPDSALMRRSDAHEYRQAYNAQAVVCAEGPQLILATNLVATSADAPSFAVTILAMRDTVGLPKIVLADTGYASGPAVKANQVEPFMAIGRTQPRRSYDFRPPPEPKIKRRIKEPWRIAMKAKMETDNAKAFYKNASNPSKPCSASSKVPLAYAASACAASKRPPLNGR